jgi:transcriptional regulator with XRE-family HTH domain
MENAKLSTECIEVLRTAIQRTFIDRCRKNPSYSLRAYAKYLEVDQSNLSKILKGQKAFSLEFAKAVSTRIGIKPAELKKLYVEGSRPMPGFLSLSDDELEFISEWYHFAILELVKTEGFEFDERSIATRLMIHVEEVRSALQRLQRLGFVRIVDGTLKVLTPNTNWANTKETTVARRKYQRSLIEKSLDAIDHVPFERRYNGSHTVAINPNRIPEFKKKLEEMREELAEFMQADGEKSLTEVYQYTFALFPLTKIEKEEKGETK